MKIEYCTDYDEMSHMCSDSIINDLRIKKNQSICVATGYSPSSVYDNLSIEFNKEPELFDELKIIKLDEWGGISEADNNSCETFIVKKILKPLQISKNRYVSFESNPKNPEQECIRVQEELKKTGTIDLCILGLGENGHIGFNEPALYLNPKCHVAALSSKSLKHQMTSDMKETPKYGLTLGMADILQSKKIILLLTGKNKKNIITKWMSKQISTDLPASFLWLHPNVVCFLDSTAI